MKRIGLIIALVAAFALALAPVALAQQTTKTYKANLSPLNGSGASGTATVKVTGNQLTVTTNTSGVTPGAPHAQHIHIGGQNVCPTVAKNDKNGDGLITTAEGKPAYGPIEVSLTTSGDVSTASGTAVKRFPVAGSNGNVTYSRTFTLPSDVSPSDIANGVVVQHGIDLNGNGKYDTGPGKSSVGPSLPLEGTIPAICGKLQPVSQQQGAQGAQYQQQQGQAQQQTQAQQQLPNTGGFSPGILGLLGGAALISLGGAGFVALRRNS